MLEQPLIIPIAGGKYRLVADYVYVYANDETLFRVSVPCGFEYDGASVPRCLWTVSGMSPDGLHRAGALIHDYLYEHHGGGHEMDVGGEWEWYPLVRKEADQLLYRMMREAGVNWFRAQMAYRAVRLAGWTYWNY